MPVELKDNINFRTSKGQGIYINKKIIMNSWGINDVTRIESPVSFGGYMEDQFDVGFIGAFTYINGQPHNRYRYRMTSIEAQKIGRFCMIAQNCTIGMGGHPTNAITGSDVFKAGNTWCENFYSNREYEGWLNEMSAKYKECVYRPLPIIGNDVWIGGGVKVLNGVRIGDGAVIACGAVVVNDVEPYTVVGGVPAKNIKKRFSDNIVDRLLKFQWWDYGPDIMVGVDLYRPDMAIEMLEEKIHNGQQKYIADSFEFNWKNNTIHYYHNNEKLFYSYIDKIGG